MKDESGSLSLYISFYINADFNAGWRIPTDSYIDLGIAHSSVLAVCF